MRFTAYSSILLVSSLAVVATPTTSEGYKTSRTAGALFFATNNGTANRVVVNSLSSTGEVLFVDTVSTGGKGSVGVNTGPDALFSQGSVLVSRGNLFVVNAGSNTLSAFELDYENPTSLKQIGKPVDTSGEFPVSVARNTKYPYQVCVLNGGKVNGVACYSMSNTHGLVSIKDTLRSLNLNQTTPPTGPAGAVSDILFTEDGKTLLTSVKGAPGAPGFIASWKVSEDGALSETFSKLSATAGALPFGIDLIPGKNALFATDPAVGATTFSLATDAETLGQNVTTAIPIAGEVAVCWVARSSLTGSFFVSDPGTSIITEVEVSENLTGKVVKQYAQPAGSGTLDNTIATIHGREYHYALGVGATSPIIAVMSIGEKAGEAKVVQPYDVGAALTKAKVPFVGVDMQGIAAFVP